MPHLSADDAERMPHLSTDPRCKVACASAEMRAKSGIVQTSLIMAYEGLLVVVERLNDGLFQEASSTCCARMALKSHLVKERSDLPPSISSCS